MLKVEERLQKIDPRTRDVLILLGAGTFLVASIVMPGLPIAAGKILKEYEKEKWEKDKIKWNKYNLWRLRQMIKRMYDSKYVEIKEENGTPVVKISDKGKGKLLTYDIETMQLDDSKWDGKWRLVIYDVQAGKKTNSEMFRRTLNKLNLLKLQKSVYLTPFKCEDEIEFLRQFYGIGDEVLILKVGSLENELAYKDYYGL